MKPEVVIKLNKWKPRQYQLPFCRAFDSGNYKRMLIIWPRRAGKDVCAFNLIVRAALREIGVYYYVFPSYSQARKVIWDSITNTGERFLDYIPKELVSKTLSQEMKIYLLNGSLIQLIGSDNIDAIVGTNPKGIVFSEYALQDPRAYQFLRPILLANDGWALFISTVRGKNHLWDMYNVASNSEDWYCEKKSVEDTQHIPLSLIAKEVHEGIMSPDLVQQEYYNSFDLGVEGAYYAKYLDRMRIKGQLSQVPWEATFPVHTAWDLGMRDSTSIIFFQTIGQTVRIIDYYENSKHGLDHYAKILQEKPYTYGKHIAPHDIKVKELGTGLSRLEQARRMGIKFTVAPNLPIADGIEAVRAAMSRIWIDELQCKDLIKSLENYRQEFDQKKKIYKNRPLHDFSSHAADAMRYMCITLPKTKDGLSGEDIERNYREAMYGEHHNLPAPFQTPRF